MKRFVVILAMLLAGTVQAEAQFYLSGTDAGGLRWSRVETANYVVIYPQGNDSLAAVFARNLERVRIPVGQSAGFLPNEMYSRKMPVLLHTQTAAANGIVTWAPRRLEMLTVPEAYAPEPLLNERLLAVHESRHVAQMQFGAASCFKGWNIVFGQIAPGVISGIYPGRSFLEGDAVLAETALTPSGRGRSADFLEYYRVSAGMQRSFYQWRYGSLCRYTPDYYATGYIGMAGVRSFYGVPDFAELYFRRIQKHGGWAFGNIHKTLKEETGSSLRKVYSHTLDSLAAMWAAEDSLRSPFMPGTRVSGMPKYYTAWTGTAANDDGLLSIRRGLTEAPVLVQIDSKGNERRLRQFAGTTSALRYSGITGLSYWSEYRRDIRWDMKSFSEIKCIDGEGRVRTLSSGGRHYNPSPSDTSPLVSVTSYPETGGSEVLLLDALDGSVKAKVNIPDSLQAVESVWAGGKLYISAISSEGFGIYAAGDKLGILLEPAFVKIKQLSSLDGQILFVCDRSGVNELYSLDPSDGELKQLSCTRNGASDFAFSDGYLYYSVPEAESRGVWKTPVDSLPARKVLWPDAHEFAMSSEVSDAETMRIDWEQDVEVSGPKPYSKAGHLFNFHSWAPLYINYDAVESMSLSSISSVAGIGATAFWQNVLGSCYGFVGVNLFGSNWNFYPSLHAKFTYTGLFPVFEAGLDFGGRNAAESRYTVDPSGKSSYSKTEYAEPFFNGSLRVYVPLSFNSGGWQRGIVPQLGASVYNDGFSFNIPAGKKDGVVFYASGRDRPLGHFKAAVRGYILQSTPSSCVYPKFGIGAEVGYGQNFDIHYRPSLYTYVYGYLPGIGKMHGIRLSAMSSSLIDNNGHFAESYVNTLPRGFSSSVLNNVAGYRRQAKFTFDYALPFANLEWDGLSPVAYVRNLELIPHFDLGLYSSAGNSGSLLSAGASITAVVNEFFRIPGLTRIGVDVSYNGGSLFGSIGDETRRVSANMILSVSL